MLTKPKPLVAGNWKMNGLRAALAELEAMIPACDAALAQRADILVCPPATLVAAATTLVRGAGSTIQIGAQDCHIQAAGAHTGDISAEMLADAGTAMVIVGHSERRADHGESDAIVRAKAEAAWRAGLLAIVCVGETEADRRAGRTLEVVARQIAGSVPAQSQGSNLVVAYEPVWAIGTGLTPSLDDVAQVHRFAREALVEMLGVAGEGVRILYGGSVKPSNAAELMAVPNVNGALVGGASLLAKDFMAIAGVYR